MRQSSCTTMLCCCALMHLQRCIAGMHAYQAATMLAANFPFSHVQSPKPQGMPESMGMMGGGSVMGGMMGGMRGYMGGGMVCSF